MLSSSGETLQPWFKPQEFDKNKKSELFSVYIGAVSEEAKEHNVGHEQSNASDHLYRVGRNVQHNTKFTDYHSNIT